MKVLVTGASGFVGRHLANRLLAEGHTLRVLSRKSRSASDFTGKWELAVGDITDPEAVERAVSGVDVVFHLAGHVGYSPSERAIMEAINVGGTRNILRACEKAKIQRLIHMSSVVAVGASFDGRAPLNEESPYNLHHLNMGYFETKWVAEQLVLESSRAGRVDAVVVNPSTIYGAGDAEKGSRKVQVKVAKGEFSYYPGGGVSVVAVEDVIESTISAWKSGRTGERYILSGENLTLKQLFTLIAEAAGQKPPRIYLPRPLVRFSGALGDALAGFGIPTPLSSETAWSSILFHWFDHGKASRELGFRPQSAQACIGRSVAWMREKGIIR